MARVGRVGEDPREDVRVGVGVVEFQLKHFHFDTAYIRLKLVAISARCLTFKCTRNTPGCLQKNNGNRIEFYRFPDSHGNPLNTEIVS